MHVRILRVMRHVVLQCCKIGIRMETVVVTHTHNQNLLLFVNWNAMSVGRVSSWPCLGSIPGPREILVCNKHPTGALGEMRCGQPGVCMRVKNKRFYPALEYLLSCQPCWAFIVSTHLHESTHTFSSPGNRAKFSPKEHTTQRER